MKITAWRIVRASFASTAFDGEGARRFAGRWNSKGTPLVYTASSRALAVVEMLVHLETTDLLKHYRLISVSFDDALVNQLDPKRLPSTWKRRQTPRAVRALGDEWVASGASVVLAVPSAVIPDERNHLINPLHPAFAKLVIGKPEPFRFDLRLK